MERFQFFFSAKSNDLSYFVTIPSLEYQSIKREFSILCAECGGKDST